MRESEAILEDQVLLVTFITDIPSIKQLFFPYCFCSFLMLRSAKNIYNYANAQIFGMSFRGYARLDNYQSC